MNETVSRTLGDTAISLHTFQLQSFCSIFPGGGRVVGCILGQSKLKVQSSDSFSVGGGVEF